MPWPSNAANSSASARSSASFPGRVADQRHAGAERAAALQRRADVEGGQGQLRVALGGTGLVHDALPRLGQGALGLAAHGGQALLQVAAQRLDRLAVLRDRGLARAAALLEGSHGAGQAFQGLQAPAEPARLAAQAFEVAAQGALEGRQLLTAGVARGADLAPDGGLGLADAALEGREVGPELVDGALRLGRGTRRGALAGVEPVEPPGGGVEVAAGLGQPGDLGGELVDAGADLVDPAADVAGDRVGGGPGAVEPLAQLAHALSKTRSAAGPRRPPAPPGRAGPGGCRCRWRRSPSARAASPNRRPARRSGRGRPRPPPGGSGAPAARRAGC
jgi:hypothetical protein